MDDRPVVDADAPAAPPPAKRRGALHATLGIASSAASMVLYPYVAAGKVAYQATSYAVHAPIKITRHVKDSILGTQSETRESGQGDDAAFDLFGERSGGADGGSSDETVAAEEEEEEEVMDLFGEQYPTIIDAEEGAGGVDSKTSSGVVSQLLFLPVRLVSSGVSTAAAIPGSLISYSGKKISGAVSTSQSLATTALVVSSGAVARTSLNVAQGLTYGAFSTASFTVTKFSGAVNTSVRTVGYAIPTSVSNAVWQGMGATGNASVSVVSYAIAVPAYRMLDALIPDLSKYFSERDCVEKTREVVLLLVKVLGPQNALYLLKFVYETVNSDEAYDMFLLCHDIVRESLDRENYRQAGSSIGASTGVSKLVPVVKEIYNLMPSVDELFDAFAFVADVSEEVLGEIVSSSSTSSRNINSFEEEEWRGSRFEYIDDDNSSESDDNYGEQDTTAEDSESGHSTISTDAFELRHESETDADDDDYDQDADEEEQEQAETEAEVVVIGDGFGESSSWSRSTTTSNNSDYQYGNEQQQLTSVNSGSVLDAGVSFLSKVCDSDEAASLFNTFGDFLDVLLVD
jgi:multidrug transporter EmrE-like cation transporter